jgi:4-amino-4-deoxy-L-arabinose transferase-like glycosyltransferase
MNVGLPMNDRTLTALAITLLIGIAIAPTLGRQEFSNSMEAINVASALEIRRSGHWLLPTLQGEPRIQKPPLTAWLTAWVITDYTMREIASPEAIQRDRGYIRLALQVRSLALIAACATTMSTFFIGRLLAGPDVGIASMIVFGSSLFFIRFTHYAATDEQLAFFVTAANLFLLQGIFKNRWWLGCLGGGVALGLAMLTKGPVALLQSVVPIASYLLWMRRRHHWNLQRIAWPIAIGTAIFLIVGLGWYLLVLLKYPNAIAIWKSELSGFKDAETNRSHWYEYFCLIPYMTPWLIFFIAGIIAAFRHMTNEDVLLLLLLLMPILLMSLSSDRYDRYLLPMLPVAAILTAHAVVENLFASHPNRTQRWINIGHWTVLILIAVALPAGISIVLQHQISGLGFLESTAAVVALVGMFIIVQPLWRWTFPVASLITMLVANAVLTVSYYEAPLGKARYRMLADKIVSTFPDAEVFNAHPRGKRPPPELGVYLNRVLLWTADPLQISRGNREKVLLVPQAADASAPMAPPGWKMFDHCSQGKDTWWAFVLDPLT